MKKFLKELKENSKRILEYTPRVITKETFERIDEDIPWGTHTKMLAGILEGTDKI